MARAVFDGVVIAESDDVRNEEGLTYFPIDSVDMDQGRSDVSLNGAFAYEHPWPLARRLVAGCIAFWQGVRIVRD